MPGDNCPEGGGFTGSFVEKYDDIVQKHSDVVVLHTDTQLKGWEAQAAKMTAESFAAADIGEFVKIYTSNGDGTFKEEIVNKYSAYHWGNQLDITQGNIADVATVEDLAGIDTNVTLTAIVRDDARGGVFIYDTAKVDENDGGTVYSGWVRQFNGAAVDVRWFGAKCDGITDDSDAINSALKFPKVIVSGVCKVANIVCTNNIELKGDGSLISSQNDNKFYIEFKGSYEQITTISENIGKTDLVKVSSTAELEVGDTLVIYNPTDGSFNPARSYYRDGEFVEVLEVIDNNTIKISNTLYSSYQDGHLVYKINPIRVNLGNLKFKASNVEHSSGVKLDFCVNSVVENCIFDGAENSSFTLSHCYNTEVLNCKSGTDSSKGDTQGTNYGIVIGNSQNINIIGGTYFGNRHGLTTGGGDELGIPVRNCNFIGIETFSNNRVQSFDFHGNIEYAKVIECTIHNGLSLGGNKIIVSNNTFRGRVVNGGIILHSEILGADIIIINNTAIDIEDYLNSNTGHFFNCQNDFSGLAGTLVIRNNTIRINNLLDQVAHFIYIQDIGNNVDIDIDISDNNFAITTSKYYPIRLRGFKNIKISDNTMLNIGIEVTNNGKNIAPRVLKVTNNNINGAYVGINIGVDSDNIQVAGNIVENTVYNPLLIVPTNLAKFVDVNNNSLINGNTKATTSSTTNSCFYIKNSKQLKFTNNILGSNKANNERLCFVSSSVENLYHGNNIVTEDANNGFSMDNIRAANYYKLDTQHLPTTAPALSGQLWSDGGVVKVS